MLPWFICGQCGQSVASLRDHCARNPACFAFNSGNPPSDGEDEDNLFGPFAEDHAQQEERAPVCVLKKHMGLGLAKLLIDHAAHHTQIKAIVDLVQSSLLLAGHDLANKIVHCPRFQQPLARLMGSQQFFEDMVTKELDIFDGLETAHKQLKFIKEMVDFVAPFEVKFGRRAEQFIDDDGTVYTYKEKDRFGQFYDLAGMITQIINAPGYIGDEILMTSEHLRQGTASWLEPAAISDQMNGTNVTEHPALKSPHPPHTVIVVIHLSIDDIEPRNPCGNAQGITKTCVGTASILNIAQHHRTKPDNLLPCFMVHAEDVKHFGPHKVLGGVDEANSPIPGFENVFSRQLETLATGKLVQIQGRTQNLIVICANSTNDTMANCQLGYEAGSVHALRPYAAPLYEPPATPLSMSLPALTPTPPLHRCRLCNWERTSAYANKPFSFLSKPAKRTRDGLLSAPAPPTPLCAPAQRS